MNANEFPHPSEEWQDGDAAGQMWARRNWIMFDPTTEDGTPPIETVLVGLWLDVAGVLQTVEVMTFMAYEDEDGMTRFETMDGLQTPLNPPDQWLPLPDLNKSMWSHGGFISNN